MRRAALVLATIALVCAGHGATALPPTLKGTETGLALLRTTAFGDDHPFRECVALDTILIDAKTGDRIYFAIWLGPPPEGSDAFWGGMPARALPSDFAPPASGGMTATQSHVLKDDFLALIRNSVKPSLMRARLLPRTK